MQRLVFVVVSVVTLSAFPAFADMETYIATCAAEKNSVKRLECYDALANKLGVDRPAVTTEISGRWSVSTKTSPIDDSTNVYMYVDADELIRDRYGNATRPSLWVRCAENTTSLFINWGVYLGLDETWMTHRIDDAKAVTSEWSVSTTNESVGRWRGGSSIPFIKGLFDRRTLLAQITPYGESPVIVTFNVSGLEEAVQPLRDACGW